MNPLFYLAIIALCMMIGQSFLTWRQFKNYQTTVIQMRGRGLILGIGLRKGGLKPGGGSITVVAWDENADRITACRRLQGIGLWQRFAPTTEFDGLSLNELRRLALAEDYRLNRRQRDKQPYSPLDPDKKRRKGSLLQAVEAIDAHLKKELLAEESAGELAAVQAKVAARRRQLRRQVNDDKACAKA